MPSSTALKSAVESAPPRLRGVFHQWAFVAALPLGLALVVSAETSRARTAAAAFAASVVTMFGASALYHRRTWSPTWRARLRRLDHSAIYGLIAGTYTPFGLLALDGSWRIAVLAIVWGGAVSAIVLTLLLPSAPKWMTAAIGVGLGWVGVVALPQLVDKAGVAASLLALAGGVCYTLGAIVYVLRRPNPFPGAFAYHEVFHAFVVAAVALQYVAVALVVL